MLDYESKFSFDLIAGVDEAGRGPLAGPVSAACVIMPKDNKLEEINDSKKLTEKKRLHLFEQIIKIAIAYKIVFVGNEKIDEINILQATKLAMLEAINGLSVRPEIVLIDAVKLKCDYLTESIIKGDQLSYNIAAASILAKVARDKFIIEQSRLYPEYLFAKHKGYGTQEHIIRLKEFGACPLHRKTFIKNFISKSK